MTASMEKRNQIDLSSLTEDQRQQLLQLHQQFLQHQLEQQQQQQQQQPQQQEVASSQVSYDPSQSQSYDQSTQQAYYNYYHHYPNYYHDYANSYHQHYQQQYSQTNSSSVQPLGATASTEMPSAENAYYYQGMAEQPQPVPSGLNPAAAAAVAALSQLSQFAGTMDAAERAMAGRQDQPWHVQSGDNGGQMPTMTNMLQQGESGDGLQEFLRRKLAGRASQRGGGRRGGGRFRGGGRGNFSQPVSNSDGSGSYFRGRGRGRGGGRRSQRHDSSSHPEIASTDASVLGHGYVPPVNVEQGDPQHSASVPSSTVTLVPAPVASATLIQKAASTRPQNAWCELCRVDCNSLEVLEQHKNGKKHKKNLIRLEKSQIVKNPMTMPMPMTVPVHTSIAAGAIALTGTVSAAIPASVSSVMPMPEVQNQVESQSVSNSEGKMQPENIEGGKGNTSVVSGNVSTEVGGCENKVEVEKQNDYHLAEKSEATDAETVQVSVKKRRFDRLNARRHGGKQNMRGGRGGKRLRSSERHSGAAEPAKEVTPITCDLCNVKCDTQAVFDSHLAGKKHISKLKRFHDHKAVHGPLGLQALYPPDPNAPAIFLPPVHQQASYAPSGPFPTATSAAQHPGTGAEIQAQYFPLKESKKSFVQNPNDQHAMAAVEPEGRAVAQRNEGI